ncbi:acetyl-CoA sensor PanZ family protein [Enterobacter cloacae]
MKLTIVRLVNLQPPGSYRPGQDWPEYSPSSLSVDETHRIYAARFNERLLAAVRVTLSGTEGALENSARARRHPSSRRRTVPD